MEKTYYDMIYLAACGINGIRPDMAVLGEVDYVNLYCTCRDHFLEALVGIALKNAGVSISKYWNEHISKAIRREILYDVERAKLLAFMEQKGIWNLPLKGIILKNYYPGPGMRQMSDNDILFDYSFCDEVRAYMESEGYEAVSVGIGNHDVYRKPPVYNFELHSTLYSELHQAGWAEYYQNVKDRLVLNEGTSYGYRFTDEDFYVYITTHAYKHYLGSGTGLRTLIDFYVYLKAKPQLDFAYIEKECEALGIAEFERLNRRLSEKVFGRNASGGLKALEQSLSDEEREMLFYYLSSGVYGTLENRVRNFQKKSGSKSKLRYLWSRLFPGVDAYRQFPFIARHRWLFPFGWLYRVLRALFCRERRRNMLREIKAVKRAVKNNETCE